MPRSRRASLRLSDKERKLLLDEVTFYAEGDVPLEARLKDPGPVTLELTPGEWDELLGYVAFAANHATKRGVERELDALANRIDELLDADAQLGMGDGSETNVIHLPLPGGNGDGSQLRLEVRAVSEEAVRRLIRDLVNCDWNDPQGPLRLADDLTLADLADAPFLLCCREMLHAIDERREVKTTDAGNLPRAFVREMLGRVPWLADQIDFRYHKVINELDAYDLRTARDVCSIARLMRRYRGAFRVTRAARELLAEDKVGSLYRLLFTTFFTEFNLAMLDRMPEMPFLQNGIAVTLFCLGAQGDEWQTVQELTDLMLPPAVQKAILAGAPAGEPRRVAKTRILRPLRKFGLLEERPSPTDTSPFCPDLEYRKSELFHRFVGLSPQWLLDRCGPQRD